MQRLSFVFIALCASCDIFHSTDFSPSCEGGCVESGSDASVTPFTSDSTKALEYAKRTCAWIAACEGPLGANQTGKCIANALLAFDKTSNPNRSPKGSARTYWQCVFAASQSGSCSAIDACTPEGRVQCPQNTFVGCNGQSRVDCRVEKEIAIQENCRAYGQACVAQTGNVNSLCVGAQGQTCVASGCSGSNLSFCNDAGADLGRDCASVGSGSCVNVFDAGACAPESSGTCAPSLTVTCDDAGVAHGCQAGVPETVNCKTIAGGCAEGSYAPFDPPSSACVNLSPSCTNDTCSTTLLACVRGRQVSVDCAAIGLKPCANVPTTPDGPLPACGKP